MVETNRSQIIDHRKGVTLSKIEEKLYVNQLRTNLEDQLIDQNIRFNEIPHDSQVASEIWKNAQEAAITYVLELRNRRPIPAVTKVEIFNRRMSPVND